jgi:hypothetical protein
MGNVLMTPLMRDAMRSTSAGFVGFLDLMRTAVLDTTVSIAFRPAAFIVSPDSASSQPRSLQLRLILTNKVHDTICNTKCAGSLHTPTQLNNLGPQLPFWRSSRSILFPLQRREVVLSQMDEACTDILPNQIRRFDILSLFRNLDL